MWRATERPGLILAIDEVLQSFLHRRCLVHKKRNVLATGPESEEEKVGTFLPAVYQAPTLEAAHTLVDQFAETCQGTVPSLRVFLDDLDACVAHLRCAEVHRKAIRATNVIERAFKDYAGGRR